MTTAAAKTKQIFLVAGADEFAVKEAAAQLAGQLAPKGGGEFSTEIIDGHAGNQDEAMKILARLREAVLTVGLFGEEKLVWWKNTNLLADDETMAEAVREALKQFGGFLKEGLPAGVKLLISAIGCDRRKTLYKTIERVGTVQFFEPWKEGRETDEAIAAFIERRLRERGKTLTAGGFELFRALVAADLREMDNELEKLCLYVGRRQEIAETDVRRMCSASRQAVVWELTDALGSRATSKAVQAVENLLANGQSALGIVALLMGQFRLMLLVRELMDRQVVRVRDNDGLGFVKAFEKLSERDVGHFPRTKEGKLPNLWRLYRCALAARNFTVAELIRAMEELLNAHLQLVSTQLDERLVLEQMVVEIAGRQRR